MANKHLSRLLFVFVFFIVLLGAICGSRGAAQAEEEAVGEWALLHASVGVSAMHMQLLPGDQLLIFDRTDFGPSNLSLPAGRRCPHRRSRSRRRLDCTAHSLLLDIPSNSFRPLTLLSDTWCSTASLLSNGSLLQAGGFNAGDRSLRLFTPSHPRSDWLETPRYLASRRWYASSQLLPDGRLILLGGRNQFNYEFFPRLRSNPVVRFPFLKDTRDRDAENNLYPFVHLLPDGTLFVFANTRSVLLDATRHRVLRSLPAIPDGVPRNYPSSGSSVLLPLCPDQDDPAATRAEILVCGGAQRGSFQLALNRTFLPAARSCGRIVVSDAKPRWSMEEMPMARVMGDMLLLPTGDVLIINGAGAGTAGWELGREPVTSPVVYRPRGPAGSRFGILRGSPIPRLYHSSAVLDAYGRVIVGGSNPHVTYNFTGVTYPTELSIEAYYPPYLDPRLARERPQIVSVGSGSGTGSVGYGEVVAVRFEVEEFRPDMGLEVVAMAPAFSTHSSAMGQRAVAMGVGRVRSVGPFEYEVKTAAPPTPEIAPPGYYLVFLVHAGVPSEGAWVKLRRPGVN